MTRFPQLRPDLLRRDVDDELLLFDPRQGETLLLNTSSAAIADLCDGHSSPEQIVDEILAIVPADRKTVAADVDRVLEELAAKGFLEPEA